MRDRLLERWEAHARNHSLMLPAEQKQALFAAHERHYALVELTESFGEQLDWDDRFIVWDYVDHGEPNIAFDHLLYRLFDEPVRAVSVTPEQADRLHKLGKAMGYSVDSSIVYRIFLTEYFPADV